MRWPFRRTNAGAADKVPDGALRRYLSAEPVPRSTPISELALLAVDFETTGLTPAADHILSVGMIDVTGLSIPLGTATNFYVNPGHEVGQSAVIHQITDDELADAIPSAEALDRVFERLTGRVLLAHHAAIEVGFLAAAVRLLYGVSIELPAVDTMALGHRALGFDEDHPRDALQALEAPLTRRAAALPRPRRRGRRPGLRGAVPGPGPGAGSQGPRPAPALLLTPATTLAPRPSRAPAAAITGASIPDDHHLLVQASTSRRGPSGPRGRRRRGQRRAARHPRSRRGGRAPRLRRTTGLEPARAGRRAPAPRQQAHGAAGAPHGRVGLGRPRH